MLFNFSSVALFGAGSVFAVPAEFGPMHPSGGHSEPSSLSPPMYSETASVSAPAYSETLSSPGYLPSETVSAPSSAQTPFQFPLANGFPNPSNASLMAIQQQAHGSLPNAPLPTTLQPASIVTFELIAQSETFEVAFFTSLLNNITNNVPGYEIPSPGVRNLLLRTLIAVQAQEELHAIGANAILASAGATPQQPCQFVFPSDNIDDAIKLIQTYTDLVLGTLQDAQNTLGTDADTSLIALIGSIIGQEGEQNGYYRALQNKIPSAQPFLTRSVGQFLFSYLNQTFIVPGTCPNLNLITLPTFGILNVDTQYIEAKDQTLQFSFSKVGVDVNTDELSLVLISEQNLPIVESLQKIKTEGDKVTFEAYFPFNQYILDGLTIAAVTNSSGPFTSVQAVANATLFGPGLIETKENNLP